MVWIREMKKFLIAILLIMFAVGCKVYLTINPSAYAQENAGKPAELKYYKFFRQLSPFYKKIPSDTQIDPSSSQMVQTLIKDANESGLYIVVKEWSSPIYYANRSTTKHDIKITANWAPAKVMKNVPIPSYVEPDPEDDGTMIVVDLFRRVVYDFWQAKKEFGKWSASWANAIRTDSKGIYRKGLSSRGSGFSFYQGMIWPHELKDGEINHALIFSYRYTKSGGPVSPATESDGESNVKGAIPEGALIQLDPDLDLDSLNLKPYEKIIAKAMQEYGMYLGDNSGSGISLYAINPLSFSTNPYKGLLPDNNYVYLPNIPVDRFRVIKLPKQTDPDIELIPAISLPRRASSESFEVIWSNFHYSNWKEIKAYNVQYKDGDGVWKTWKSSTTNLKGYFSGKRGHTYYFRVRARYNDYGGYFGAWSDIAKITIDQ